MAKKNQPSKKLEIKLYAAESLTLMTQAMVKVRVKDKKAKGLYLQIQNNHNVLCINKIKTDTRNMTITDDMKIWFENLDEYDPYRINEGDHIADLVDP